MKRWFSASAISCTTDDRLVLYHPDGSADSWDWLSWGLTHLRELAGPEKQEKQN